MFRSPASEPHALPTGIIGELPPELRSAASNGDSGGALLRLLQRNTQQSGPPGPAYPPPRPQQQQAVSQEGSHAATLAMAGLRVGQPAQQATPRSHAFTVPAPHFGPPPPDAPPARQMWTPPPPVNHGPIGPPAPRQAYGLFAAAQQQQLPTAAQSTPPARVPMARTDGAQSAEPPFGRSPPASAPRVNQREVRENLAARHAERAADSTAIPAHARGRGRGRGGGGGSLKADGAALSAQLAQLIGTLQPQELDVQRQRACFERVKALVTREWPQAQLLMYGSCANSFGGPSSDVDTCLALPWADRPERKRAVVQRIAQLAQADGGYLEVMALTHARMPVAKLVDARTGVACDVCVNNFLAVFNTRMLRDYAALDPRLRLLGYAVKHWAKRRQVNEPYTGTLSSYCYILMCIHLLQSRQPPVLPVLQSMSHTFNREVEGQQGVTRVGYHDDVQALQGFGARNSESLAQLLHAFFDYWAHRHDYGGAVVCVRTGGLVSKRRKGWTTRVGTERHLICIEDPFEVSHDLGRVVDKRSIGVLRDEFERAERILSSDAQPLEALFAPYVAPNEGSGAQRTGTAHAEDEIEDSQLPDFL